ncbi:helix-turn-helix transcriptional regulator [Tumebacillus sp. ITR2]|uniref:Helix-turn-helix transcriptional regulator n=1 Tax=Tumebacillus amylolyticus TaxID=2801339 RepID=A0ABS1JF88_9BACL|nr:helix-turn-helix transcriptional regulator [Tumebacillus amylolyticus]MBL0388228.1 helix-turn-helix transcriptional regulator [Tumebacillus amylolyticus]
MIVDQEMTIGQRFKKYRKAQGLSQQQLSEGICSYSTVSQIECDRALPSVGTLEKLAERLCVPLREILGEQERTQDISFQLDVIRVSVSKRDYAYALELIQELEGQELLEHQRQVLFLNHMECMTRTGYPHDAARRVLEFVQAQEKQQTVSDETLCDAYNKLGNAYYFQRDYEKAYSAYEHGYHVSLRQEVMTRPAAAITLNLGIVCNELGFKEDAQLFLDKARDYYSDKTDLMNLARSLFSLAIATKSKEYIVQALSLYNSLNDLRNAYVARQHYLYYYEAKDNYKGAVKELQDLAFKFENDLEDPEMSVYLYGRAFMVCFKSGDQELADVNMSQAEKISTEVKDEQSSGIAYLHRCKALNEMSKKNFENAIIHSLKSSELYGKMKMYTQSAESLQVSADIYSQMGKFQEAYEVLTRVNKLLRRDGRESYE